MRFLKLIYLTICQLAKQAWMLPTAIAASLQRRRHQTEVDSNEVERLDRIRNPSKYLGK
jgi:hypothetical protein